MQAGIIDHLANAPGGVLPRRGVSGLAALRLHRLAQHHGYFPQRNAAIARQPPGHINDAAQLLINGGDGVIIRPQDIIMPFKRDQKFPARRVRRIRRRLAHVRSSWLGAFAATSVIVASCG